MKTISDSFMKELKITNTDCPSVLKNYTLKNYILQKNTGDTDLETSTKTLFNCTAIILLVFMLFFNAYIINLMTLFPFSHFAFCTDTGYFKR